MNEERIMDIITNFFVEMSKNGLYFECGTLVFNTYQKEVQGLHVVVHSR